MPSWPPSDLKPAKLSKLMRTPNIGMTAHIDAGKATVSERFLYYLGRIHKICDLPQVSHAH